VKSLEKHLDKKIISQTDLSTLILFIEIATGSSVTRGLSQGGKALLKRAHWSL